MSTRRPPAEPPELPGFTYRELLGSGGFADVFLYEQHMPRQRVAVKVLLTERLTQGSADAFHAEANIMAQLAAHPAIATIYQAGLSGDGRPYLVMKYYPNPNLQTLYRRRPFSVAEALRVGVQISAAVETAHRAGILHRDVKPANILVTEYNHPALTDFGISVVQGSDGAAAGMSIPWSPPEVFADDSLAGPSADVYSLAATVYTLLAGHSPFEFPGQRNTSADLIQRIETVKLPALDRADVPESLTRALERAMAKSPRDRYATALELARALQHVQAEMGLAATPIDVLDETITQEEEEEDDDGSTVIRKPVIIDPTAPPRPDPPRPPRPAPTPDDRTADDGATIARSERDRIVADLPVFEPAAAPDTTMRRSGPAPSDTLDQPSTAPPPLVEAEAEAEVEREPEPAAPRARSRRVLTAVAVAAAVIVLGGAGFAWAAASGIFASPGPEPESTTSPQPQDPAGGAVPRVTDLEGTVTGSEVEFTWTNPEPEEGDSYRWALQRTVGTEQFETADEPTVTVPADPSGTTCIEVFLVRANGTGSQTGTEGCAP